jgi:predicted phosphodiesterase
MKIALITDTHFGVRNDSPAFLENLTDHLRLDFFPYLKENGITEVYHLGDLMDRRKYVNYRTARSMRESFLSPILSMGGRLTIIAGNHDEFYRNTHDVNALDELVGGRNPRLRSFLTPYEDDVDGLQVLLVPWITDSNREETMTMIRESRAAACFGHLELSGFEYSRGIMAHDDAMSPDLFKKFDITLSGHYHHRSSKGGVHYLGSPSEHTWSDYKDPRGFHVLDTDRRDLRFVENRRTMFMKVHYDDSEPGFEPRKFASEHDVSGKVVKLVVHSRENPFWLDTVIDVLDGQGPEDMTVVEDHLNMDEVPDTQLEVVDGSQVGTNLEMMRRFSVELASSWSVSPEKLDRLVTELYNDALALE